MKVDRHFGVLVHGTSSLELFGLYPHVLHVATQKKVNQIFVLFVNRSVLVAMVGVGFED